MDNNEIIEKLNDIESFDNNKLCEKCGEWVKHYVVCTTPEMEEKCPRLRPPKEYKSECKYCGKKYEDYLALGGHMVNCKMNPKWEERNKKIKESHLGLKQSEECKKKISESMKEYLKDLEEIEDEKHIEIETDEGNKIDLNFY